MKACVKCGKEAVYFSNFNDIKTPVCKDCAAEIYSKRSVEDCLKYSLGIPMDFDEYFRCLPLDDDIEYTIIKSK